MDSRGAVDTPLQDVEQVAHDARMYATVTCAHPDCGDRLMPQWRWESLSRAVRRALRREGVHRYEGRGLCRRCHSRAEREGTLDDYPRHTMSRDEVLAEWEHLDLDRSLSRKRRVELAAPRLGMTACALEKALDRGHTKGRCGMTTERARARIQTGDSARFPVESDVNEGRFRANGSRPSNRSILTVEGGG